jgi:phosphotransferase system HPr (HPr) family protein
MITHRISLRHALRFHARPVAILISEAERFHSEMYIRVDNVYISLKSIIGVMTLGLAVGDQITLEVNGSDEVKCMEWLIRFFEEEWPQLH